MHLYLRKCLIQLHYRMEIFKVASDTMGIKMNGTKRELRSFPRKNPAEICFKPVENDPIRKRTFPVDCRTRIELAIVEQNLGECCVGFSQRQRIPRRSFGRITK